MTAIVHWCAFLLSVAAMADAIAHGAWIALFCLVLATNGLLRLLWPAPSKV